MSFFDEESYDAWSAGQGKEFQSAWGAFKKDFSFLKLAQLPDCSFSNPILFRHLPPKPTGNPEGFLRVSSHTVLKGMGDETPTRVECTLAGPNTCAICDFMLQLVPHKNKLSREVFDTIQNMNPANFKAVIYPVLIYAEPGSDGKDPWKRSENESGAMLQVFAKGIWDRMRDLIKMYPNLMNPGRKGFYLGLVKDGRKYEVYPLGENEKLIGRDSMENEVKQEPVRSQDLLQKYSEKVDMEKMFFSKMKRFNYDEQKQFLETCWFWKDKNLQAIIGSYDTSSFVAPKRQEPVAVAAVNVFGADDSEEIPF
jgi:hypothetical protein